VTTIGERIYARRRELGLSQREISSPGVSYAYVSRIENGTREPSVRALRKLAGKLGVSAHWLETGEADPAEDLARIVLEHRAALPERAVTLALKLLGE
jgi:transcriptional regulator with XRE-family HTH domain